MSRLQALLDTLLCFLCLGLLLLTPAFGNRLSVVVTGSMSPAIQVNAPILVHRCGLDEVEVGDMVSYWYAPRGVHIAHRVVDKGDDFLITRGDANGADDPLPVTAETFRGKIVWVGNSLAPVGGALVKIGPEGRCALAGALCGWAGMRLCGAAREIWERRYGQ